MTRDEARAVYEGLRPELQSSIDTYLKTYHTLPAIRLVMLNTDPRLSLIDAQHVVWVREAELNIPPKPPPTLEIMLEKAEGANPPIKKVHAEWEGDTGGWGVILWGDSTYLGEWRAPGGDSRLLAGTVPPWPEVKWAKENGTAIAEALGIPYIPCSEDPS